MTQKLLTLVVLFALCLGGRAQVLPVSAVTQEENQWCWVGCSKCILGYYGVYKNQCEIAEYARQHVTWMSFGTTDCCISTSVGCNNPNYEANHAGSIQDIMQHYRNAASLETTGALTKSQISTMMASGLLFVQHWSWYSGGAHFVVGHGIAGNDIYFMNPWPGEGMGVSTYEDMVDDGVHRWDYTLSVTAVPAAVAAVSPEVRPVAYPSPSAGIVWLHGIPAETTEVKLFHATGKLVFQTTLHGDTPAPYDLGHLPRGMYLVLSSGVNSSTWSKLVLQ